MWSSTPRGYFILRLLSTPRRSPNDAPGLCRRHLSVTHDGHTVYEHVLHANRKLVRLLVRRAIYDRIRIEDHDIGVHSFAELAPVADAEPVGHGASHFSYGILER